MYESEIFVVDVKRTPRAKARIRERMAANKCIACECSTELANPPGPSKQTCEKCRSRLRNLRNLLPPKKRALFDAELVKTGRALVAQEIRFWKKSDAIQEIFDHIAG